MRTAFCKKTFLRIVLTLSVLICVYLLFAHYVGVIIYNYSPSVPIGFYRVNVNQKSYNRGELIVYRPPESIQNLINSRHYIGSKDMLIKPVAGVPKDNICYMNGRLEINGKVAAIIPENDSLGRPMPKRKGCFSLKKGEYITLVDFHNSLDSRYHGIVSTDKILGRANKLYAF